MQANLNVIGIMIIPIITLLIVLKYGSKQINARRILKAFIFFVLVVFISITFSSHLCNAGNPVNQWFIPSLCIFLVIASIENKLVRRLSSILLFIFSIVLSQHFIHLVHTDQYTGNPHAYNQINDLRFKSYINALKLQAEIEEKEKREKAYPKGWIDEIMKEDKLTYDPITDYKIEKFWHTRISGLYKKADKTLLYLWYPGGYLKDNYDKIELREKTQSNKSLHRTAG